MPNTPSIVIEKTFVYRGNPETFSNKYHFSGTQPADATAWKALADAIIAAERPATPTTVTFTGAYGYNAGVRASVWQVNYADPPNTVLSGSYAGASGQQELPGDVALWVRWSTGQRSVTGKPIYLRKYFHGIMSDTLDKVATGQRTAYVTFAGKLVDGTLPGGFRVCRPQGGDGSTVKVPTYTTTRTLKRRGKDPS